MRKLFIYCFIFIGLLCSCGTTYVHVDKYENYARIYKDDKLIGYGKAKIRRSGVPKTIVLTAKDAYGNELGRIEASRDITVGTVALSFLPIPSWLSFIFNWKYDHHITIPINEGVKAKSKWDGNTKKKSVWD